MKYDKNEIRFLIISDGYQFPLAFHLQFETFIHSIVDENKR